MASGHVNRIKRPNTWLHRPMLQNMKKALANPEPSTHGRYCCKSRKSNNPKNLAKVDLWTSAALLFNATTEVHDRFWMKRYGPSRRRAQNASAALRIFVRYPKRTFATISATSGSDQPYSITSRRLARAER